jgi:hypothetical protein
MDNEPPRLASQCFRAPVERSQPGTTHRRQIRPPTAVRVWLDMARATNRELTQQGQINLLAVNAPDIASTINHQFH